MTFLRVLGTIPPAYSIEAEKYADVALHREPLFGEKGRGTAAEYTVELTPERLWLSRRVPGAPVTARECGCTP